jgi:hypothetical protein
MSTLARPSPRPLRTRPHRLARFLGAALGLLLALGLTTAWPATAGASIARTVRWTASPLKSPSGETLPPAASYEVWLVEDAKPETLAAAVRDTFWTLQARPGAVYTVRVRAISALGLKSVFSPWSDPWWAAASPVDAPAGRAALGAAHPNPFNARTALAYTVPTDLPTGAGVALEIYDVRGHRVCALAVDRTPGPHEAGWNGTDAGGRPVPAGVYLAQYICGAYRATVRVTLVA